MSDKKNIDRLFQEKFKDFEAFPPEQVWQNIEKELQKKKKKRVVPIWWYYGGIAASILLFATIVFFFNKSAEEDFKNNPAIVNEEVIKQNTTINDNLPKDNFIKQNQTVSQIEKKEQNAERKVKNSVEDNIEKKTFNEKINFKKQKHNQTRVAETKNRSKIYLKEEKTLPLDTELSNKDENISKNESQLVSNDFDNNEQPLKTQELEKFVNKKPAQGVLENKDSSAVVINLEQNPLEKLLEEKEQKNKTKTDEEKINRWQVATQIAPVYFNSLTSGSPLDAQFADNTKSYQNTLSVGVGVNYAINTKITIRTGVNSLLLDYNTNDVSFYADMNARTMRNITQNLPGAMMAIEDVNPQGTGIVEAFVPGREFGSINQRIGFVEVPLEVSYKIVDKKFGFQIIGGLSTLFLTQNEIALISPDFNTAFGEATNLNNIHFSSNLGLGFSYKFWKSFRANLEPTFKYQMNTFSNDAGNFRPYFIGLYSGISYSF